LNGDIEINDKMGNSKKKSSDVQQIPKYELSTSSEPVYCICGEVSHGEMVQCDNEECITEWFHMPCVGLKKPPIKTWYCPDCCSKSKHKKNLE
jgi:hypothetical protein